jgi:hypothetical protein
VDRSDARRAGEIERVQRELRRGLVDPDRFFADRGITLSAYEAADEWWVALGSHATQYGRGASAQDAKVSAVRRWMVEQEGPDLARKKGETLP